MERGGNKVDHLCLTCEAKCVEKRAVVVLQNHYDISWRKLLLRILYTVGGIPLFPVSDDSRMPTNRRI